MCVFPKSICIFTSYYLLSNLIFFTPPSYVFVHHWWEDIFSFRCNSLNLKRQMPHILSIYMISQIFYSKFNTIFPNYISNILLIKYSPNFFFFEINKSSWDGYKPGGFYKVCYLLFGSVNMHFNSYMNVY